MMFILILFVFGVWYLKVRLGHGWFDKHETIKKRNLIRSKSDTKISYSYDDCPEAPGSSHYITADGDIDLLVVLKVISYIIGYY